MCPAGRRRLGSVGVPGAAGAPCGKDEGPAQVLDILRPSATQEVGTAAANGAWSTWETSGPNGHAHGCPTPISKA